MKKLIVCFAFLAITSYAHASYGLIGDWESLTNDGWYDHPATGATGWTATVYVDDPLVMPSRYEYSYNWSTEGYVSLRANVTGWDLFMGRDIRTDGLFWNGYQIEFDIYAVAQPGSDAAWAQVERIALSTQTNGWTEMANSTFSIGLGGTGTHCVYDYSRYKTLEYASRNDEYEFVIFAFNADAPVYLYIDNIWLTVPEPATLTLLGFGGLTLFRRKK